MRPDDNDTATPEPGGPGKPGKPAHGTTGGAGGQGGRGGRGAVGARGARGFAGKAGINARENWYRDVWLLIITSAVCYVLLFALPAETKRNTHALCTLRGNLERRGQQSNDFLRTNPNGALGIPPGVIAKSIRDTRQTIRALHGLKC